MILQINTATINGENKLPTEYLRCAIPYTSLPTPKERLTLGAIIDRPSRVVITRIRKQR